MSQCRPQRRSSLLLVLLPLALLAGVATAGCPFGFSNGRATTAADEQQLPQQPGNAFRGRHRQLQQLQQQEMDVVVADKRGRGAKKEEEGQGAAANSTAATPMAVQAAVRSYLLDIFRSDDSIPPLMVRLAWHDAGTYNAKEGTGGPDGSIRFEPEFTNGANTGLSRAVQLLEPVKQVVPSISYADLYQLASVEAIKYCGGPDIPFRMGRKDVAGPDERSFQRLPDAKQGESHLRDVFYRMGFVDREIVALSGAHTLGRAHFNSSGFEGPWTHEPLSFDNGYYQALLGDDASLLKLPSDLALLNAPSMRKWVELYARDQAAFFADYVESHTKLSELGVVF